MPRCPRKEALATLDAKTSTAPLSGEDEGYPQPAEKRRRGQKPITLSAKELEHLGSLGCTIPEIAEIHGVTEQTIRNRFHTVPEYARAYRTGLGSTKQRLRRAQLKHALQGNTSMLVWLGKNLLGQVDSPAVVVEQNVDAKSDHRKINFHVTFVRGDRARLTPAVIDLPSAPVSNGSNGSNGHSNGQDSH